MKNVGSQLQQTKELKSETEPNNLFEPIADDRVKRDFSDQERPSVSTWVNPHPLIKWGAIAALGVAALTLLATPTLNNPQ